MATAPFTSDRAERIYANTAAIMCCICSVAVAMGVGGLTWSFLESLGLPKGVYGLASLSMASSTALAFALGFPPVVRRVVRGRW